MEVTLGTGRLITVRLNNFHPNQSLKIDEFIIFIDRSSILDIKNC